jgi:hypothetical protein
VADFAGYQHWSTCGPVGRLSWALVRVATLCRSAGKAVVPIGHVCRCEEIVRAHKDMEASNVSGKLVVAT